MWNWRGTGEAGNVENSYHYRYYEMDEMKIDWDAVAIGFETNRDWYYEVQEAYRREIANGVYGRSGKKRCRGLPGFVLRIRLRVRSRLPF